MARRRRRARRRGPEARGAPTASSQREIIVNSTLTETRVGVLEQGTLVELLIDDSKNRSIAGNIYKGRVLKILPGMQAAFVDIGLAKDAFLYVRDIWEEVEDYEQLLALGEGNGDAPGNGEPAPEGEPAGVAVEEGEANGGAEEDEGPRERPARPVPRPKGRRSSPPGRRRPRRRTPGARSPSCGTTCSACRPSTRTTASASCASRRRRSRWRPSRSSASSWRCSTTSSSR